MRTKIKKVNPNTIKDRFFENSDPSDIVNLTDKTIKHFKIKRYSRSEIKDLVYKIYKNFYYGIK
jgi:hypothetical protein